MPAFLARTAVQLSTKRHFRPQIEDFVCMSLLFSNTLHEDRDAKLVLLCLESKDGALKVDRVVNVKVLSVYAWSGQVLKVVL